MHYCVIIRRYSHGRIDAFSVIAMVSHDMPADPDAAARSMDERRERALQRLDDGHAALRDALAGLDDAEAFLGSRWSVWEVMQHLLTENFVAALEEIAAGERDLLPAFDGRGDRIAADIARLESNYQRFRALIGGLSAEQLNRPATPANPENDYPALSLLDLIERVAGHEGNHARQVAETRKYVGAFRSQERAVTVAGLGVSAGGGDTDADGVPLRTRELLSNADYVAGTAAALAVGRRWIRGVELEMRPDNRAELVNRLARDARAGLWSMVITLGDPAESAPDLLRRLDAAADAVSVVAAPGFYRAALAAAGISPLAAVCVSVMQLDGIRLDGAPADGVSPLGLAAGPRTAVILGADCALTWGEAAGALLNAGLAPDRTAQVVSQLDGRAAVVSGALGSLPDTAAGEGRAAIDSALIVLPG